MNKVCLISFRGLPGLLILATIFWGCQESNTPDTDTSYDRQAMLAHYADELIIPAFDRTDTEVTDMANAVLAFANNPTTSNLSQAQQAWITAYTDFQLVTTYNFGPGENPLGTMTENLGTWPVDMATLEGYVAAGDTSLGNFNRDTRGFLALDYLLFDLNNDPNTVVAKFSDPNRRAYLRAVTRDITQQIGAIKDEWAGYRDGFVSNDGTGAGSSASLLFNSFVQSFEALKNFKLGLPLGKRPGQVMSEPERVEAYYSGVSTGLLLVHLSAVERTWRGADLSGTDGNGFDDYVRAIPGGPELYDNTVAQFTATRQALENIPAGRLSDLVAANDPQVITAHEELQKLTRFIKSDMSSLLGISITFDSGDGD